MHQKGNDYPLINPRRQLISLTILCALKAQKFQKKEKLSLSLSRNYVDEQEPFRRRKIFKPTIIESRRLL